MLRFYLLTSALWLAAWQGGFAQELQDLLDERAAANQAAQSAQARREALDDDAQALAAQARRDEQQGEDLTAYNQQLANLIAAQDATQKRLAAELAQAVTIERMMVPLMLRQREALEELVAQDVPFLRAEREERLAQLRAAFDRADMSAAEKYRLLLAAWDVETAYGRTIEAYDGAAPLAHPDSGDSEPPKQVQFLRIGRLALFYQTLDGAESGAWRRDTQQWEVLPKRWRVYIERALAVAREEAAPALLILPLRGRAPKEE